MLNALAGGDAIEIIVGLRDMTEAGFKKVEHNLSSFESKANSTNLSGFSRATKNAEKDAENLAGKETKGGGGIGGAVAGLLSLGGGPVTIALAGMAAVGGGAIALTDEYGKVEPQIKALNTAFADHGESLQALEPQLNDLIDSSTQYGYTADDVRAGVTQLTEAGLNFQQVQAAMPHIMDLARAKNIDLATATTSYTSAVFGNARALKQYGIILPPVTASSADLGKAQDKLKVAHENATKAEEQLTLVEDKLKGKHTLTAAEAIKLHDAEQKVKDANDKVTAAQQALTLAQQGGVDKGARLSLVNQGLGKAINDQRSSTTEMEGAQARLNNAFERAAVAVGPGLEDMFSRLLNGIAVVMNFVMDTAIPAIGNLFGWFGKLSAPIQFLLNPLGALLAHLQDIVNIAGKVMGVIGGIGKGVGGALGAIGGLIPHFASGAVVSSPTLALIGEGGEREAVIPESKFGSFIAAGASQVSGGGGLHVHFNSAFPPTPSMAADLADALERELGRRVLRPSGTGAF